MTQINRRYAVCFHGLSTGYSDRENLQVTIKDVLSRLRRNLEPAEAIDIFLHTWEADSNEVVLDELRPVASCIEPPKVFHKEGPLDLLKYLRRRFFFGQQQKQRKNAIYSRWYSFRESVNLLSMYEKKEDVKYDFVMCCRFDLWLNAQVCLNKLADEGFYVGTWTKRFDSMGALIAENTPVEVIAQKFEGYKGFPHDGEGVHDFWFAGNRRSIEAFSRLYEDIGEGIAKVGLSSHKLALWQIQRTIGLESIEFGPAFPQDYTLARWR